MTRRGLILAVVLGVLLWLAIFCVAAIIAANANPTSRTPTSNAFPAGPCDFEHRLDIEIIDGEWFECSCQALTMGWDCAWFALDEPAVAPPSSRKVARPIKRHHAKRGWHLAPPALSRRPA